MVYGYQSEQGGSEGVSQWGYSQRQELSQAGRVENSKKSIEAKRDQPFLLLHSADTP